MQVLCGSSSSRNTLLLFHQNDNKTFLRGIPGLVVISSGYQVRATTVCAE